MIIHTPKCLSTQKSDLIIEKYACSNVAMEDINGMPVFMQPSFFRLHSSAITNNIFYLARKATESKLIAACQFGETSESLYKSPIKGSFGGLGLIGQLGINEVEIFLETIVDDLAKQKAKKIYITLPPLAYFPSETGVALNVFFRLGFEISGHELSFVREVDPAVSFRSRIASGNKNKINKCIKAGFLIRKLEAINEIKIAHEVISKNRAKKNIPLTMDWDSLENMHSALPSCLVVFGCFSRDQMVASAICIQISPGILYIFYWGEWPGFEPYSPVSLLAQSIYEYAERNGFRMIDAGTSTENGEPNYGLINYKKGLGFVESIKLSIEKRYNEK